MSQESVKMPIFQHIWIPFYLRNSEIRIDRIKWSKKIVFLLHLKDIFKQAALNSFKNERERF